MDDLVKAMLTDLPEEIADCKKYLELAEKARDGGMEIEAHYLDMMAYDEFTHARFLLGTLDSLGAEVADEVRGRYARVKEQVQGEIWV
jgi:rubrerythrin